MSSSFQRQHYSTDDPDEGHAYLRSLYTDFSLTVSGSEENFRLVSDVLQVGSMAISRVQHSMAVSMFPRDGLDWTGVWQSRLPTLNVEVGKRQHRFGPGDAIAARPHVPYRGTWDTLDNDVVVFDPDTLNDVAAELTGSTCAVVFDFDTAISPLAGAQWRQTLTLVRQVALANATNPGGALLADSLSRLLATTALTCFGNTAMSDREVHPTRSTPESLARAVAYIDDHLDSPIRLVDLAHAAGVSERALNLTFNRHHGISPIGYIRRARLDAAHRDLRAAEPGDGRSVTAIAAKWGFHDLPRFGVLYRRTYGRPPSRTLRGSRESR